MVFSSMGARGVQQRKQRSLQYLTKTELEKPALGRLVLKANLGSPHARDSVVKMLQVGIARTVPTIS